MGDVSAAGAATSVVSREVPAAAPREVPADAPRLWDPSAAAALRRAIAEACVANANSAMVCIATLELFHYCVANPIAKGSVKEGRV